MRTALLIYEDCDGYINIGDYIQSLAAKQFLNPTPSTFISRERLNKYKGENVLLIMNGWFTHKPKNWPPSSSIIPLFVSFHINSTARKQLLDQKGIDYLKEHQPIGCRDTETVALLQSVGIEAYFSGCLTLTLGETYKANVRDENVCFVDPFVAKVQNPFYLIAALFSCLKNFTTFNRIVKKIKASSLLNRTIKGGLFYYQYKDYFSNELLSSAEYITQEKKEYNHLSEDKRFELAESLLRKYARSKMVVTSRIHSALPCLGLSTPVIYINNLNQSETSLCRLGGLIDLFHVMNHDGQKVLPNPIICSNSKITIHTQFKNKENYIKLKEDIIEKCRSFVKKYQEK